MSVFLLRIAFSCAAVSATADAHDEKVTLLQLSMDVDEEVLGDPTHDVTAAHDPLSVKSLNSPSTEISNETWIEAFKPWAFLHVGKAGGGAVTAREKQLGLHLSTMHPRPPPPDWIAQYPNVMINVRDPIDRFVSAFNWQLLLCCSDDDSRHELPDHVGVTDVDKGMNTDVVCQHCSAELTYMMNVKYEGNVSMLAEALCSPSEGVRQEAAADVKEINHLKFTLADWLESGEIETKDQLLMFVLEPGFDFESQIDAGFAWVLEQNGVDASPKTFPERQEYSASHASSVRTFPELTVVGARCLAQYYSKDYHVLDLELERVESWCHGGESHTCTAALQSILDRRVDLRLD